MLSSPIRIVLVDGHRILLESLAARINDDPELQVVGTADEAESGLQLVLEDRPNLVILDVELQGRGSFDIANEIATRQNETKILFLTGYLSDVFVEQALRVNAGGYLMKGEPTEKLIDSIKRIYKGETCFSAEVEKRVVFDSAQNRYIARSESRMTKLTPRQLEVLRRLAKGQSVKQVAKGMHLSEKSIDSHKYRIMHKLEIHDRVELARYAIREGLTLP